MTDEKTRRSVGEDARAGLLDACPDGFDGGGGADGVEAGRARVKRRTGGPRRTIPAEEAGPRSFTPMQRLLLLDVWLRSKLSASEFSELAGVSTHSLYTWKKKFDQEGPAGLVGKKRGAPKGSRLPEPTRRH